MTTTKPETLCMAPWTHTYLSPQTERRMCCASREPAQSFTQYIDTAAGTGKYTPITLDQHWNSEHMKSVRRRMMAGETLPECDVCNNKLLNTDVYRSYFWSMFKHKYDSIWETTDSDGTTSMQPVSWDYRFSNLCNFKCRMCGDMLSSAWESEQRQHNMVDWSNSKNNWMQPEVRKDISQFQDQQIEAEFAQAVEEHRVEEVYWVGGEPLMYEQHWRYMKRIVELGDGHKVYARYNTNLSRINYRGIDLFDGILHGLRDWQICASLDGTQRIGEYIRTGLDYDSWRKNYDRAVAARTHRRQVRIDFTLTLPGMFEIENIVQLAQQTDTDILAKVVFAFSPDIVMSPLALPRHLLDPWLDELITSCSGAMQAVLVQLKTRPTFEEQWPDTWQAGLVRGKQRVLKLEQIREDKFTMADILAGRPDVLTWWNQIDC
jgi:organic radical activating enzyme